MSFQFRTVFRHLVYSQQERYRDFRQKAGRRRWCFSVVNDCTGFLRVSFQRSSSSDLYLPVTGEGQSGCIFPGKKVGLLQPFFRKPPSDLSVFTYLNHARPDRLDVCRVDEDR